MLNDDLKGELQGLVEALAHRELDAWVKFAELAGCWLFNMFMSSGLRREDAEDLACSCVAKAVERIRLYDPIKGNFISWIYGIAKHALHDYRKKNPQTEPLLDYLQPSYRNEPCEIKELELLGTAIEEALGKLSAKEQEVVKLAHMDGGLSRECIGRKLGLSPGAVRVSLCRALKKLGKILAADLRTKPFMR